jgi:hypothetical protein
MRNGQVLLLCSRSTPRSAQIRAQPPVGAVCDTAAFGRRVADWSSVWCLAGCVRMWSSCLRTPDPLAGGTPRRLLGEVLGSYVYQRAMCGFDGRWAATWLALMPLRSAGAARTARTRSRVG